MTYSESHSDLPGANGLSEQLGNGLMVNYTTDGPPWSVSNVLRIYLSFYTEMHEIHYSFNNV